MGDDRLQGLRDKLEEVKAEIEGLFAELGVRRDQVIRAHEAIDIASAAVASSGAHLPPEEPVADPQPVAEPVAVPEPELVPVEAAPAVPTEPAEPVPDAPVEPQQ